MDAEDLVRVALEHGQPLPDTLHAAAADPPVEFHAQTGDIVHAPNATIDDMPTATPVTAPRSRRLRRHHLALLIITVVLALIAALLVFDHRSTPCKLQIVHLGAGGTIEQCLSQTATHAGTAP